MAALTLPSLIAKQKQKETVTRLKKFYSTMSQAIVMSEAVNGDSKYWDKQANPTKTDEEGNVQYDDDLGSDQTYAFIMKYIAPYIKYTKIEPKKYIESLSGKKTVIYFADDSEAYAKNGACIDFNFDVNGERKPNKYGYDIFTFVLCSWTNKGVYFDNNMKFGTYMEIYNGRNDRQRALNRCKESAYQCARLLELDGWEIKKDYPYHI